MISKFLLMLTTLLIGHHPHYLSIYLSIYLPIPSSRLALSVPL